MKAIKAPPGAPPSCEHCKTTIGILKIYDYYSGKEKYLCPVCYNKLYG